MLAKEPYDEMLDYYNKSSLIQLYSLLENSLKRLCSILKQTEGMRVSEADLGGYIAGSIKYLDLIIGLPKASLEQFETKIKIIQYLRNRIVHDHSEFSTEGDDLLNEESNKNLNAVIIALRPYLVMVDSPDEPIRTLQIYDSKYILECFQLLREYFMELFWLINEKYSYSIVNEKLNRLLKGHLPNVKISNTSVERNKSSKIIRSSFTYFAEDSTVEKAFQISICISRSGKYIFKPMNQTEDENVAKWIDELSTKQTTIKYWSWDIVSPRPNLTIEILVY